MPGPEVRGGTEEADHLLRVRVVSVGYAVVRRITKDKTEEPVLSLFSFETRDVSMPCTLLDMNCFRDDIRVRIFVLESRLDLASLRHSDLLHNG